jgi:hypothetical protein
MTMSLPDWTEPTYNKILEELQLMPDGESACALLFSLLYAVHTVVFTDGDRHLSALKLAEQFTELAAELREKPH